MTLFLSKKRKKQQQLQYLPVNFEYEVFFFISISASQSELASGWTWLQPNSYFVFGMAQTCTFSELES